MGGRNTKQPGRLRIGTSGYQYDHWRGRFYPRDLPKARWFEHYARVFDTVEINNTFYRLPEEEVFRSWHDRAPPGFRYAVKFSRYGSHMKRLRNPGDTLGVFLERAEALPAHLGPVLVQLPPHWNADPPRLDAFLAEAPRRHRWAVEFRDPDWLREEVFAVLRRYGAALCVHDLIPDHPRIATADWIYLRFHGEHYASGYSPQFLAAKARRIRKDLAAGHDVWAYFNNDLGGHAVRDAGTLRRYLDRAGG